MTPQARRNAALKAAATKRRNAANARAGGYAPPPPRHSGWPPPPSTPPPPQPPPNPWQPPAAAPRPTGSAAFTTPKPTVREKRLEVVAALENLFVLVCRDTGITDERRQAFELYKKTLNRAIAPSINPETQREADVALRLAAIALIKQTF